jgi:hypothetical protein
MFGNVRYTHNFLSTQARYLNTLNNIAVFIFYNAIYLRTVNKLLPVVKFPL